MYSMISRSFVSTNRMETGHFQQKKFQERAMRGFWKRVDCRSELEVEHWEVLMYPLTHGSWWLLCTYVTK